MREVSRADWLREALNTFQERRIVYGKNYLQYGKVMTVLFANGFELKTEEEWNRFGIINMIVSKLTRYSQSWPNAHIDSIHDLGVYAFMLESLDINDKMSDSLPKELD